MDAPFGQSPEIQETVESEPLMDTPKLLKRGRPRIDRSAETAGERRKEQIRLAQRAYRFRKELRIAVLDQKVAELEQTITAIRDLYLSMHNAVFDSGVALSHPFLSQSLQKSLSLLLSLTQSVPITTSFNSSPCVSCEIDGQWDEGGVLEFTPQLPTPPLSTQQTPPQSSLADGTLSQFDSLLHSAATSPEDTAGLPQSSVANPHWTWDDYFWQRSEAPINDR
ncbi:bZIP transcription factor [Aspergillus clavatus NRRL 1]|uniref:BZIP domain-containing protein n=1 Tax=Aspergillus clavatus (strain ATCC 1007 / CBS 513.65 / DSM 816 / NCTC 3887 / NRRL 1 / QM 1276 / 107) TaxID=344612 RepID=A1CIX5_ASPCL|nr:uncharacterized protein ACLA_053040 [Aspergillus clavatus NRRL 1]EAW10830.1 hypothetical protein ACLA_053040 [Aspergillus clavatus NRRL 1]